MRKDSALLIAGLIFTIVALFHLLRCLYQVPIILGPLSVPIWISWVAFVVATLLALFMFKARARK